MTRYAPTPKPSITAVWEQAGGTVHGMRGGWSKAKCPLHEDRTASASINEELGKFQCFACDLHGDAWDFISVWQNLDFVGAKEYGKRFTPGEANGSVQQSGLLRRTNKKGGKTFVPPWKL